MCWQRRAVEGRGGGGLVGAEGGVPRGRGGSAHGLLYPLHRRREDAAHAGERGAPALLLLLLSIPPLHRTDGDVFVVGLLLRRDRARGEEGSVDVGGLHLGDNLLDVVGENSNLE